jgi:hypothetical protein
MASTRAVAWRMASAGIENEGQRASAKAAFDGLFVRLAPRIYGALPSLLETYAQVYAREFSSEDLRQMIAFGQTSAGKHFLLKYALLDTDPAVLEAQTDLLGRLSPIIQEYQKEMCGKRAAARIAAGDTKAKCPLAAG